MKKTFISILCLIGIQSIAQDVIIKNDKTELKTKVMEITEAIIKYKKWDNLDGPVYNLPKVDVFMIIYQNGQRETIQQSTLPISANNYQSIYNKENDTTVVSKKSWVHHSPTRILYTMQSAGNEKVSAISIQSNLKIVKNFLNLGSDITYYITGLSDGVSTIQYAIYLEPYLPLNRLMGNLEKQNSGLFINGKIGYSDITSQYKGNSSTAFGIYYGVGIDLNISKSFGLSVSAFKFDQSDFSYQAGLLFNW